MSSLFQQRGLRAAAVFYHIIIHRINERAVTIYWTLRSSSTPTSSSASSFYPPPLSLLLTSSISPLTSPPPFPALFFSSPPHLHPPRLLSLIVFPSVTFTSNGDTRKLPLATSSQPCAPQSPALRVTREEPQPLPALCPSSSALPCPPQTPHMLIWTLSRCLAISLQFGSDPHAVLMPKSDLV